MNNENWPEQQLERLDLTTRNMLQIEIIKRMLTDGNLSNEMDWIKHPYSKVVSDIIDYPENKIIRDLALAGKYSEAAELLEPLLLEKVKVEEQKKAA